MVDLLGWLVFGFFTGELLRALLLESKRLGVLTVGILGAAGGLAAGMGGQALALYPTENGVSMLVATAGAAVLVGGFSLLP